MIRTSLNETPVFFTALHAVMSRSEIGCVVCRITIKQKIGNDLATVQVGWPVGMPLCRSLGDGLWEARSSLPSRRIARLIFCLHEGQIVILNGFIKKTQKAPQDEINLAQKRMKKVMT